MGGVGAVIELECCIQQTASEVVLGDAHRYFFVEELCKRSRIGLLNTCGEVDRFTYFDIYVEVARYIEIFCVFVAALPLLDIFILLVPMGIGDEFMFLGDLKI